MMVLKKFFYNLKQDIKKTVTESLEGIFNPKGAKTTKALIIFLVLSVILVAMGFAFRLYCEPRQLGWFYFYLSGMMFSNFLNLLTGGFFLIKLITFLFMLIPLVITCLVSVLYAVLETLRIKHFAKHVVAEIVAFLVSAMITFFPFVNLLMYLKDHSHLTDTQIINIFVFGGVTLFFIMSKLSIWFAAKHLDSEYKAKATAEEKNAYLERVSGEASLVYTFSLLLLNALLKVFLDIPEASEFINALFVSTTIISLALALKTKWKSLDDVSSTNN